MIDFRTVSRYIYHRVKPLVYRHARIILELVKDTVNGRAQEMHQRARRENAGYRLPSPGVTLWQITGYQAEV